MYLFLYFLFSFSFLPIECQVTCFKNSSYILSKRGRVWHINKHICSSQGGDLVSIETEEEWQFINREIQKRGTWTTGAWHIGLRRKARFGPGWVENDQIFRNGKFLSQMVMTERRKYPRMEASLMVCLRLVEMPSFARRPEVRSHSNHKVYNEVKH